MPININENLPAKKILTNENIFVMSKKQAEHQDIRPLKIAILNLMPTKVITETQILRLLGNSPLQVEIELLHPATHTSKNTPKEHLTEFYKTFDDIKNQKFDGLIITGAPVETLPFSNVTYWKELTKIMDWATKNVFSTLYLCWGAQAGLYHHYKVPKYELPEKMFGVFKHRVSDKKSKLMRGFDDIFYAPHSRDTEVKVEDIEKIKDLKILSKSNEAGVYIVASRDGRHFFVLGHSEYDAETLKLEYERDIAKGLKVEVPENYFTNDNPSEKINVRWRSHANLLFVNWLNYFVYQETPYEIEKI